MNRKAIYTPHAPLSQNPTGNLTCCPTPLQDHSCKIKAQVHQ